MYYKMDKEFEDDGITFEQWKYIFWACVKHNGIQLFIKDEKDLQEYYDDDLSPEDAINIITAMSVKP